VENMSVEGLFVHGGDLWRLNTPLSCLQPPQQGKTLIYTVYIKETPLVQTRYVHQQPLMILCALLLFITNGSA
ncbi:hypothetical protein, partial [Escherichia coli]|uniref:hypothetical protein n=1 Tax=Escherichia coli TaxID=562 RepID=UPI000A261D92